MAVTTRSRSAKRPKHVKSNLRSFEKLCNDVILFILSCLPLGELFQLHCTSKNGILSVQSKRLLARRKDVVLSPLNAKSVEAYCPNVSKFIISNMKCNDDVDGHSEMLLLRRKHSIEKLHFSRRYNGSYMAMLHFMSRKDMRLLRSVSFPTWMRINVADFLAINGAQLTYFYYMGEMEITYFTPCSLGANMRSLHVGSVVLSDNVLNLMKTKKILPSLQDLSIGLSGNTIRYLNFFTSPETIKVSVDGDIDFAVVTTKLPNLTSFSFNTRFQIAVIANNEYFSKCCENLKQLVLVLQKQQNVEFVANLLQNCTRIQTFSLHGINLLATLKRLDIVLPNVRALERVYRREFCESDHSLIGEIFPNLKVLSLAFGYFSEIELQRLKAGSWRVDPEMLYVGGLFYERDRESDFFKELRSPSLFPNVREIKFYNTIRPDQILRAKFPVSELGQLAHELQQTRKCIISLDLVGFLSCIGYIASGRWNG